MKGSFSLHSRSNSVRARVLEAQSSRLRRAQPVSVRAESGGLGGFFKKDGSREDAARKALQDAFAGKKDPFALDEKRRRKEGGSGGGGGGGGGFNFSDFSDGFGKWLRSTLRGIAATLAFFAVIALFYLWKPFLDLMTTLVRFILRLDGGGRARLAAGPTAVPDFSKKERLGNVEESVMSKWGADDVEDEGEYEDDDEDEGDDDGDE